MDGCRLPEKDTRDSAKGSARGVLGFVERSLFSLPTYGIGDGRIDVISRLEVDRVPQLGKVGHAAPYVLEVGRVGIAVRLECDLCVTTHGCYDFLGQVEDADRFVAAHVKDFPDAACAIDQCENHLAHIRYVGKAAHLLAVVVHQERLASQRAANEAW